MKKLTEVVKEIHDGLLDGSVVLDKPQAYTPGPWEIVTRNPYRVMSATRILSGQVQYGKYICDTANNQKTRTPENAANARLIAAAPELLKACKALVEQFHAYENGWLGEDVWRIRIGLPSDLQDAEKAIAKATGEVA